MMKHEVAFPAGHGVAALIPHGALADPDALSVLRAWSHKASVENPDAYSGNTWRAYRASWAAFCAWASTVGQPVLPAQPAVVALFLAEESAGGWMNPHAGSDAAGNRLPPRMERAKAVGTVMHRATTISVYHQRAGLPEPCKVDDVQLKLRDMRKKRGTDQRQAKAITQRVADRVTDRVHEPLTGRVTVKDLRDLALMLVGRDLLARASELVSLTVEDRQVNEEGVPVIWIRRIKTSTKKVPRPLGPDAAEALDRWQAEAGVSSGPIFRAIGKGQKLPDGTWSCGPVKSKAIGVRDVVRAIKRLAGTQYSAHSMRVGMAKDLAKQEELPAIMQAGDWKSSEMVSRYIEDAKAGDMAVARYHAHREAHKRK